MGIEDIAMAITAYVIINTTDAWAKNATNMGCTAAAVTSVLYVASAIYLLYFMVRSVLCYFGG